MDAATKTIKHIRSEFDRLLVLPSMGRSVDDSSGKPTGYRFTVYGDYITAYRIEGEIVRIMRVLNRHMDFVRVLLEDEQIIEGE